MRGLKIAAYLFFLVFFLSLVSFFILYEQKSQLLSPIVNASHIKLADNVWFPKQVLGSFTEENTLNITAEAAFFVDLQSGEVLFEKNSHQKLAIASLTKIMTAALALENKDWKDKFIVSKRAAETEPDSMLLKEGEVLTLEEILGGVFLVSGNDAAEVLAEGTTGRREEFINLMNQKAQSLGMKDTKFINPTGLEEDNGQSHNISTAFDIAILSRYTIFNFPHLLDITSSPHIFIPATDTHQDYDLYSGINLLTTMPGVLGFKTGFTPEAGLTLVTVAKRGERRILGVLLNAPDRRDDARELLEFSFKKLEE